MTRFSRHARRTTLGACVGLLALVLTTTACSSGPDIHPDAPGTWHQVFEDDFTGNTLDTAKWATCYDWNDNGCTNVGNHESEWYLPTQVSVSGGALTLSATRKATMGSDGTAYPWTSGMISTGRDSWNGTPHFTFTRGYVAAAIDIPPQSGMFPAFWLMPASRTAPPELDVAEFYGTPKQVQMTVHWASPTGSDVFRAGDYGPANFAAGYHVFALDWEADSLTWFVDGVPRYWVTDRTKIPDVPMEVLLDLAVGIPTQPAAGVNSAQMKVQWVRVWQH